MKIASAWSTDPDAKQAAIDAYERLCQGLDETPQLMLVHSSSDYDNETLLRQLRSMAPESALQGGTSCLGVMTETGFHTESGLGMGILGVHDPSGSYGVGMGESAGDPRAAAVSAVEEAQRNAGHPGEVPAVVVITQYPGDEDQTIRAIEKHIGARVPIIGGTSADNNMSGKWLQFADGKTASKAVSVAALFPSAEISYAFHSGYEPTSHHGRVTRAGGRVIHEIDGRPAARVYNEWTEDMISDVLSGGSLVPTATFTPVGNPVSQVGNVQYFRLSYPVAVVEKEALELFTDVEEGAEIVLMRGTHDSLATRAGRVATEAINAAPFGPDDVQGALMLFCTGCMLAIQDRMDESVEGLRMALNGAPYLCVFTLGEQGCFVGGENRHGNLMVAALAFGPIKTD